MSSPERTDIHGISIEPHEDCPDPKHCACECRTCKRVWLDSGRPKPGLDPETLYWAAAYLEKDYVSFLRAKSRNEAYLTGLSEAIISLKAAAGRVSRGEDPRPPVVLYSYLTGFERFLALRAVWNRETGHMSDLSRSFEHPAYRAIVAMGREVVPFMMEELERDPHWWFDALREIYGEGPEIPEDARGRLNVLAKLWLDWFRAKNEFHLS